MKNQPNNLEEAVKTLMTDNKGIEQRKQIIVWHRKGMLHHGFGTFLRNSWNLWNLKTPIVQWFKKEYGITHADDIYGLIVDAFISDLSASPRNTNKLVKKYKAHWKALEMSPIEEGDPRIYSVGGIPTLKIF